MDHANGKMVSREEQKIWDELECEIENDLEQEIKDGLSMLARRLQILYQKNRRSDANEEAASNLSIVIRLGMGCDIEIKEGGLDNDRSRPYTPCSEPRSEKTNNIGSHRISQFGSSKASMTTSKCESMSCINRPLQEKKGKNSKVIWKY
ncbi:hypothetical protein LUZ61_006292 [Rhynchospora tenuis]|uniref:Uncharacterized protein n=1 Tax=Rhynchospora tenuis TaxID=198213 RepID=A0AAD5ZR67_9POAL|nr:hypothetical protein LUZ61_006292 [Rhynchospora tenuis]